MTIKSSLSAAYSNAIPQDLTRSPGGPQGRAPDPVREPPLKPCVRKAFGLSAAMAAGGPGRRRDPRSGASTRHV